MGDHYQYSDDQFAILFESCELAPELFSHEAHLRLAWIHISKYGTVKAIDNITKQIKVFATNLGSPQKYNHTVTIAAIKAVAHFMNKSEANDFKGLMKEFPRLKDNFKELLFAHYSINIFTSELAKQEYLEPDLVPFD